jgi:hypothetical protein
MIALVLEDNNSKQDSFMEKFIFDEISIHCDKKY